MFAVRIHGRGGQGAVTAAEMLSVAAFREGRHAQAFPTFGSERTGAPVVSFCRVDDKPIRLREPITEPDAVIVQDPTLLHQVDVFGRPGTPTGYLLLNTSRTVTELGLDNLAAMLRSGPDGEHQPATDFAREHLGRPLPNAALLGGFAALTGQVSLGVGRGSDPGQVPRSVRRGKCRGGNRATYEHVLEQLRSRSHA